MGHTKMLVTANSNKKSECSINPATGKVIKEYELHSAAQADEIVKKAHEAYIPWRAKSFEARGKIVKQIAAAIEKHRDELARLMAEEMGKPVKLAQGEIDRCITICNYTADEDYKNLLDEERPLQGGKKGIISYEPLGVILGIQPWNFPLYQVVRYSIPNLMAGNAVLLKHAANVWGMAGKVKEIYEEAGLPQDLFGVLYLDNEGTAPIIRHDLVRGVAFTGSAKGGAAVAKLAGEKITKTVLELGGSDPYIVLDDADLDQAVQFCTIGRTANAGQTCVAAKRFIVVDSIYEEFKERFTSAMGGVAYGDPLKKDTQMGPIARADLRENLHRQVTQSIEKGATPLLGCEMPEGEGYFYPASILADITPDMPAYNEELFGPVASLIRAAGEEEAITIANDHEYGLGAGVFSRDEDRAINVARRIESGMVSVNGFYGSQPNLPFGGVKNSGYGREHGGFGIREFVNIKSIMVNDIE